MLADFAAALARGVLNGAAKNLAAQRQERSELVELEKRRKAAITMKLDKRGVYVPILEET